MPLLGSTRHPRASLLTLTILASISGYTNAQESVTGFNNEVVTEFDNSNVTVNDIINEIKGNGFTLTNPQFSAVTDGSVDKYQQLGLFTGYEFLFGNNFGSGAIMTTGRTRGVLGVVSQTGLNDDDDRTNTTDEFSGGSVTDPKYGSSPDDEAYDRVELTFDAFAEAGNDTLIIDFIFGSDEYTEFAGGTFADAMVIIVGNSPGVNCVQTPDGQLLNVNTVNSTSNSFLFINNDTDDGGIGAATQMDGYTKRLTCRAPITPETTTPVLVGIADKGDASYDSWAFFKAQSLRAEPGGDWGDAPDTYFTLNASGGAVHTIKEGVYLGKQVSGEVDGFKDGVDDSAGAALDDDDDGVEQFPQLNASTIGGSYSVDVETTAITGQNSTLIGWIDFDHNGQFDADEAAQVTIPDGTYETITTLTWSNLNTTGPNVTDGTTYARFRIVESSESITNTDSAGSFSSGEVEDYRFNISGGTDTTPPVVVIDPTPKAIKSNQNNYPVTGTCEVGDGDVTVGISGASPSSQDVSCLSNGTWTANFDVSGVADGSNQVVTTASQTDFSGNQGNATPVSADKDTTDPVVTIDNLPTANVGNSASYPVTGTCTAGDGDVTVSLNGGNQTLASCSAGGTWSTTFDVTGISDGSNVISIDAEQTDVNGYTGNASQKQADKDTSAPTVSIDTAPTANISNRTNYVVSGSCSDDGTDNVNVAISGASPSDQDVDCSGGSWTATFDVSSISDGTSQIVIDATHTDPANNVTNATQVQRDKDTVQPLVAIVSAPTVTPANQTSWPVSGTCEVDGTNNVVVNLSNGASQTLNCASGVWSTTFDVSSIPDGDPAFTVSTTHTDNAGNQASAGPVPVTKDTTPPVVTIDSPGWSNIQNQTSYPVSGTCTSGDGDVEVTVTDGTPETQTVACNAGAWSATVDSQNITDGNDTVIINASQTDAVGNTGVATQAEGDKDTVAPQVAISNVPAVIADGSPFTIDLTFTEAVSGFTLSDIQVTNATLSSFTTNSSSSYQVTVTPDGGGNITITVPDDVATDVAANNNIGNSAFVSYDSDNDGLTNNVEAALGTDPNNPDTDGDGIPDNVEVSDPGNPTDTDNDGIIDALDPDDDNDGIATALEDANSDADGNPQTNPTDSDGDGTPDYLDSDSDADNIPDRLETNSSGIDADNDGIPDDIDASVTGGPDANNDGVDDNAEATNTTGTGSADYLSLDADGDGLPDYVESGAVFADSDSDGIDNYIDADFTGGPDANNDGFDDTVVASDADGDSTPDFQDKDADNDGLPDTFEAQATTTDTDGDGIADTFDVDQTGGADANGDGIDDNAITAIPDTDNDGIADYRDKDSDGDGLPDSVEMQSSGSDSDADGIDDAFDVDQTGGTDANGDGIDDNTNPYALDFDNDGVPDFLDSDSDNDGISDGEEANVSGPDTDGDGIPDSLDVDQTGGPDTNNDGVDDNYIPTDTDGDGAPDYLDRDADGDGVPDAVEGTSQTDNDGTADYRDADSDNDGIPDSTEAMISGIDSDGDGIDDAFDVDQTGGTDANNDGVDDNVTLTDSNENGTPDYLDNQVDTDGDGLSDVDEGNGDIDVDGIPNYADTDSDGDGIPDSVEGQIDSDGDGTADYLDTDSDNDGISDALEGTSDSDLDGTPDYLDTSIDEDNDGVPDIVEGTNDTDGDGTPDYLDADSDNDGLPDGYEFGLTGADSDGDGIDDYLDADSTGGQDTNNDGIDDSVSGIDTDGDGVADYQSVDADGDGVPDRVEIASSFIDSDQDGIPDVYDVDSTGGVDEDADGIDDQFDADFNSGPDANGDGINDLALVVPDHDGDQLPDHLDADSDNDSISDGVEANATGFDNDGDGIDDAFDSDYTGIDTDGDGYADGGVTIDTDGDGIIDMFDLDSDNDGRFDSLEASSTDADRDGIADSPVSIITNPVDSDGDGIPDFRDLDSNNDGNYDIDGTPESRFDNNGDGRIDLTGDIDGDGIDDAVDSDLTIKGAGGNNDIDFDGAANAVDNDDDNDGLADITEGTIDSDGDGIIDSRDADSDNDGIPDVVETDRPAATGIDDDFDGIDNAYDVDSTGGIDADNDGVDDQFVIPDTDGDGIPDYLDTDSDNDGLTDAEEQSLVPLSGVDRDNDGIDDAIDVTYTFGTDSNNDGVDDNLVSTSDFDGDGLLNYRDNDSDGDGIEDAKEGRSDSDGDGIPDYADTDSDNDGIPDIEEGDIDTDGDGIPNRLDLDSDGDGIPDNIERTTDTDGDGIPNYLEKDSDNDGIDDDKENGDFNQDGINDRLQAHDKVESTYTGSGSMSATLLILGFAIALVRRKKVLLLCMISLFSLCSKAESESDSALSPQLEKSHFYVFGGYGVSRLYPDNNGTIWRVYDDSNSSALAGVGYMLKPKWSIEVNYAILGEAKLSSLNPSITDDLLIDYKGLSADILYWLKKPQSRWNVYIKGGAGLLTTKGNLEQHHRQVEQVQLKIGVGAHWQINDEWGIRLDLVSYDEDARIGSLQVVYRFTDDN
ncbi:choice-of-anchor L domain-containing protein [Alteromonas confluentis]|uniref:Uncharacterized protein n=1 Tax=Alteromonas confluentis TaxID=1656094 RepID=A0A1E7ZAL6_9ALTE|nr:choice-of-anchor L domain-containing protein [Alteromonas confluentis]OFC70464.1 hypothetical protein BFC18_15005 [Alteromonas confluentis]